MHLYTRYTFSALSHVSHCTAPSGLTLFWGSSAEKSFKIKVWKDEILKYNPIVLSIRTNSPFYRRTKAVLVFILCWLSAVLWWAKKKLPLLPAVLCSASWAEKWGHSECFALLGCLAHRCGLWFHTKLSSLLGQATQHAVVGWCSLKLPWQIGLNTRAGGRGSTYEYTQNKCCTCNVHYLGTYVAG